MTPKILVFAGSNRSGSFSRKLARAAAKTLALMEAEVTMIALADYPLPLLDEDLKKDKGVPENAVKLARMFAAHDALFVASPEYNASISPLLKNAIDWIGLVSSDGSRSVRPFDGLTVALGSVSGDHLGGVRGVDHLRAVLMHVGAQIVSEQCPVPHAERAFGEDGMPSGEREAAALKRACRALIDHCTPGRAR